MEYSYIRNIAQENQHFYGWGYIINEYIKQTKLCPEGVVLDTWVDQRNNTSQLKLLTQNKWVGILHATPKAPSSNYNYNLGRFINSDNFKLSKHNCIYLITTSEHSKKHLTSITDLPVKVLLHPKPDTGNYFDIDYYISKPIIRHSGFHARNIDRFLSFKTGLQKIIYSDREIYNSTYLDALKVNTSDVIFKSKYLNNYNYIKIFTRTIGYNYFNDCSASNSILEHIMTRTPLIVNRIPPVEEYLGKDYPLYLDRINGNVDKHLQDKDFLNDVSTYLHIISNRKEFSLEYFNNFLNELV